MSRTPIPESMVYNPYREGTAEYLNFCLNSFLSKRVESIDGGYPEVTNVDLSDLHDIIDSIIRLKWGPDCDGDYPVDFQLINRNRERFIYPSVLPHVSDEAGLNSDSFQDLVEAVELLAREVGVILRRSRL